MAQTVNYNKYRGDDLTFNLTFKDSDGNAIDITGYTIFFTLKESLSDSDDDAKIKEDVTNHTNPTGGITKIEIPNGDTNSLVGEYYYDIQYKTDTGKISTIQSGTIRFNKDVTRRTS